MSGSSSVRLFCQADLCYDKDTNEKEVPLLA